ncbi:uncharacterized protein LOC123524980 [Mercenaria mercenaria]|uniref:uncharacterized protein LOC123524980 n=1 Tax=Mercenaria mercenaria TaxID=6596 RepID=UPI001E1DE917|nr:uncharacterized protein LOC123524980 [Mercenaria mercenaria]
MMFAVFVLLVSISCCSTTPPRKGYLYDNRYYLPHLPLPPRPTHPPTTTPANPGTTPTIPRPSEDDERLAAEIGVKIPSDDCVISWEDFKNKVANKPWIGIYGLDDDKALNPGVAFKGSLLWNVINETTIRRRGSFRDSIDECLFADGVFKRADDSLAIFQSISGNLFAAANRKDYLVCGPEFRFCIFFIVYDTQNNRQGRGNLTEAFLLVKDQRSQPPNSEGVIEQQITLNDLPWTLMDKYLQKCLGQTFVDDRDPQLFYAWKNPSCAAPGTAKFDEGAMAG